MKINIQKTKNRFISMLGAVVVFVSCLVVPAQAETLFIDYYVSDVYAKNGTPYVTVDFPIDYACWVRLYNLEIRNEYKDTASISGWIQHRALNNFEFECWPLGYSGNYPDGEYNSIDVSEFPSSFDIESSCNLSLTWDNTLTEDITVTVKFDLYQVDYSGSSVAGAQYIYETLVSPVGPVEDSFTQNLPLNFSVKDFSKDPSAVGLVLYYSISFSGVNNITDTSGITYVFQNERCAFDFSVTDEFYKALQEVESNRLLGKIEDHLEEQNQTLDDIFEGTPEQNQQAQDSVGGLKDSTDKLGALGDTMASVEKPVINSSQISAGSLVPETSLVVLSAPFHALWENEILLAILTIVVTLVLVSWVFFGKKG